MTDQRAPWREVAATDGPRSGRGSVLGPDTTRRTSWWILTLTCGHVTERTVRYRANAAAQRGGTQNRAVADARPAPNRVRCAQCDGRVAGEWRISSRTIKANRRYQCVVFYYHVDGSGHSDPYTCPHFHRRPETAIACATREAARRNKQQLPPIDSKGQRG